MSSFYDTIAMYSLITCWRRKKVGVSIDPFNGRNPGYCFVDLNSSDEDAQLAITTIQGQLVHSSPVKVNSNTQKKLHTQRLPAIAYNGKREARKVPTPNVTDKAFAFDRWSRNGAPSRRTAPLRERRRLHVGGLSSIPNQDVVNFGMRALFQNFNVEAVSKILPPSESARQYGGSRYYCFVDVSTPEEVRQATENLDGMPTPHGGSYQVSIAVQKRLTKVQREQLGVQSTPKQQPRRDLASSWRRVE